MEAMPFESREELMDAAKKEASVCGDCVKKEDDGNTIEIYNSHAGEVRWRGKVVKKELKQNPWYENISTMPAGPSSGTGSSGVSSSKRPYSDSLYIEMGVMRKGD